MSSYSVCQRAYDNMEAPSKPYDPLDELTFCEVWDDHADEYDKENLIITLTEGQEDLLKDFACWIVNPTEHNLKDLENARLTLSKEWEEKMDNWTEVMIEQAKERRAEC